ncbi:MAG: hypothetical protein D8M57_04755 [Candidatus Scalindua sp. AMX11]|nr:MAG: hypothetical protein DWQ00_03840 [Candidatus Scalindua sp.]RZV92351.1 MAG: hypothetical protein EX341_04695 [Candidatus Scalindua sp. SCAELEC01]TDE66124.1 MAG: hypothetical protein D8M57_04755 [Candidatus Scalindua sp. AMX11]
MIIRIVPRFIESLFLKSLKNVRVVTLLGPRQAEKTTLTQKIREWKPVECLDLEDEVYLDKLG